MRVWRLAGEQVRHRPGRSVGLGAGILLAALAFTVLTGAARTSQLRTVGLVRANARSAYDILVRPPHTRTRLEVSHGLVRANYLSGIFGGITMRQYRQIRRLPGVEVAAPIANIGYVMPLTNIPIDVTRVLTGAKRQLFRLTLRWTTDRGLSSYPDGDIYLYVTREPIISNARSSINEKGPDGRYYQVCSSAFTQLGQPPSPFQIKGRTRLECESTTRDPNAPYYGLPRGHVGTVVSFPLPMLISAIDPHAEARLDGVNRAVTSGRYLTESDRPRVMQIAPPANGMSAVKAPVVPMLAPTSTVIDTQARVAVQRLATSNQQTLPAVLPAPTASRYLSDAGGTTVRRLRIGAQRAYRHLLRTWGSQTGSSPDSLWTVGPVTYRGAATATGSLTPRFVHNPLDVWRSQFNSSGWVDPPMSAEDVQFRRLSEHIGSNIINGEVAQFPSLKVVGRFDVAKMPGFGALSAVPMETYNSPEAVGADPRSRALLHGRPLVPNGDPGGYLQQPPLLLTTLSSIREFTNPQHFRDTDPKRPIDRSAPISVIRVRVAGVSGGADPLSRARVNAVATAIHHDTGLAVDITMGSSPTAMTINLPAGLYGRPALRLSERWTKKGVAVAIVSAVDRKSALLFALILVVCALFVFNTAIAAVRARRVELGVLSCLGWPAGRIFATALGEVVLIGLLAGIAGTALAWPTGAALGIHVQTDRVLLVTPVAVGLAAFAGAIPAWAAARAHPADAVRPVLTRTRRARHHRGIVGIALANLARRPGRTILAALALAVGICAITLLLGITYAFHGQVIGTLLGDAVTVQVRAVDYIAAATTLILGTGSVIDVLYLNLRERAAEFATLHATGWSDRPLITLIAAEAAGIGLLGAGLGAAAGLYLLDNLAGKPATVLPTTIASAVGGVALAIAAAATTGTALRRLPMPELLAAD